MLADDEGIVLDSLKMIINRNFDKECQIETAKTGRDVIELAERFCPDIAFMDIQMPGAILWQNLLFCLPMTNLIMQKRLSIWVSWNMSTNHLVQRALWKS